MYDNCGAFPYCEVCANYIDKIRIVAECIVVPYRGNFGEIELIGWRVKFWQFHHVLYNGSNWLGFNFAFSRKSKN